MKLALDRRIVQSSNLVYLESDLEATEWVLLSICVSVHMSVRACKRNWTFMEMPMYF